MNEEPLLTDLYWLMERGNFKGAAQRVRDYVATESGKASKQLAVLTEENDHLKAELADANAAVRATQEEANKEFKAINEAFPKHMEVAIWGKRYSLGVKMLADENAALRKALGFARSCILSGENWSPVCDSMINKPLGLPPEIWTDKLP